MDMGKKRLKSKPDMKVVMIGDSSVGKTCLILRYIDRHFQDAVSTIGASFVMKSWGHYSIAIWDTAGGEKYAGLSTFYYRNASAAVLAFDMFDRKSFETLLQRYIPILNHVGSAKLKVVVATKRDLLETKVRMVSEKEGIELAKQSNPQLDFSSGNVPYFETSSKTGENVDEMFEYIFQYFYPNGGLDPRYGEKENDSIVLNDTNRTRQTSFSCCY